MSPTSAPEVLMSCSGCGATVYPEHLERHVAGYWSGQLYCSCCLADKKGGTAPQPIPDDLTTFPLEDADSPAAPAAAAPPPAPTSPTPPAALHATRRPPRAGASGATRMRIFHSKLSDGAVIHLDQQINDWLDQNPDVEIKFSNTAVGTWEGKHPEPNLILALFY